MSIRWVIQNNLINPTTFQKFKSACKDYKFQSVEIIPFSNKLPNFIIDECQNIYYGSTTFIMNLYGQLSLKNRKGIFFNPNKFTMENYINQWEDRMLNSDAIITTFEEFLKNTDLLVNSKGLNEHLLNSEWFIRPNDDSKYFSGGCLTFSEIKEWYKNLEKIPSVSITKIVISKKKMIDKEWRLVVVNGEVITSCLYRENFQFHLDRNDCPKEIFKFAEECCKIYQPSKIFIIDICQIGNEFKIIECNCFNMSGFYNCDLSVIVDKVSKFVSENSGN